MKKILSFLFSNMITLLALFSFALSMAYATFAENDFGTPAAREMVYDAWWFELIMLVLVLNFVGNIYKYRLFRREKLSILLFHLAFVLILIGAFVTRYTGYEGLVRIREGDSTKHSISQKRYLKMSVEWEGEKWTYEKELGLTRLQQPDLSLKTGKQDDPLVININRFVPDAVQTMVEGKDGDEVIELVAALDNGRNSFYLATGGSVFLSGHEFTFNNPKVGAINLIKKSGYYQIASPEDLRYIIMSTQRSGLLPGNKIDTLRTRTLYQSDYLSFVIRDIYHKKMLDYQTTEDKELAKRASDLLFVKLGRGNVEKTLVLAAVDGVFSPMQITTFDHYKLALSYGPSLVELPFSLWLGDFQLERYPGSTSPSSYASQIMVDDGDKSFPYTISMNNVLDHRGYRFFQASYDLDELGTVLSVNRDYWGTKITYLGYFLMGLGMLSTLFGRNSRFRQISMKLNQLKLEKTLTMFLLFGIPYLSPASTDDENTSKGLLSSLNIDKRHAETFGKLLVQDMDGRIKPVNSLASEFLRKLTRKTKYRLTEADQKLDMNSDQVFLSIHCNPVRWQQMPLIKVDQKKGALILEQLELANKEMLTFQDLLDDKDNYRLRMAVEAAQLKKPAERSELDNEIIKIDERFNILFQALAGNYLKIFPQPKDQAHNWFNSDFRSAGFSTEDSLFVRNILFAYYQDIATAQQSGDWSEPNDKLAYISTFQTVMGSEVIPDKGRMKTEILYNKLNVFNRLFSIYWLLGIYLLTLALLIVFINKRILRIAYITGVLITGLAFLAQTSNMILRWYAADYPPWSNGYEMIILVCWALFLFGFIFHKKSDFILPMVSLFGGTLMFVSYLDWLNPEITNLVPVLKSYWLKIHVAIIVSSYAPLALSALLGFLSLVFMISRNEKLKKPILELTYINELSMTIGLFMLAIGTFLGGVWANESWGRYWGWDPKETWALISIIIYAMVLHLRLIPSLRGEYTFGLASVLAFFSIVMTSFGVNYYLSGLHSYAAGDPLPIPHFVYWVIGIIIIVGVLAYINNKKSSLEKKTLST